jgi:protein-tyrosine phosphatase/ribose 5-phosphate isomerase B
MRVIFVCAGNTCRSPMAEALLKRALKARGRMDIVVESAGLSATPGEPASWNACLTMKELGIQLNLHRARPLFDVNLEGALILTMTKAQADYVKIVFPSGWVQALRSYAGLGGDVDDPYGGSPELYMKTALRIAEAVEAAADKIILEEKS